MSNRSRNGRTITAYFEGINAERYEDVAALFAENGELCAPGTEARQGVDIAAYFAAALALYPEHVDDPSRVLHSGDSATVEICFTGRTASGFELKFDAVDVFDFDAESKIVKLSSWYDSYAVRQDLKRSQALTAEPT
jgi:ketosteroid isomerase-like protein